MKKSGYSIAGIPDGVTIPLTLAIIALALSPYLAGTKIAGLEVPSEPEPLRTYLQYSGPVLVLLAVGLYLPVWPVHTDDAQSIQNLRTAFNRPAFQVSFANEAAAEDFIRAIEDTIRFLSTGVLFDRTGNELQRSIPPTGVSNAIARESAQEALSALSQIGPLYRRASEAGKFRQFVYQGSYYRPENDRETADAIDDLTIKSIRAANLALGLYNLAPVPDSLVRDASRPR